MSLNPHLISMARSAVNQRTKQAFQPPQDPNAQGGGDPSMGGMPPGGDPAAGGMPPGAPMDPAMAGGGMPMDPAAMGGAPVPGAGGMNADTIRQVMQEVLGQMGMVPGQAGPGAGGAGGKPGKPDLLAMSMDIFQIKKMLSTLINAMGVPMPQEIIDGPNRDPATGAPMPPGAPGSTSDPSQQAAPAPAGGQPSSAIQPIGAMQGAFPAGGGGGGGGQKSGGVQRIGSPIDLEQTPKHNQPKPEKIELRDKASALSAILKRNMKLKN